MKTKLYPDKYCNWCEKPIVHKRQSKSEWELVKSCGLSCSMKYRHHKCTKANYEASVDDTPPRYCKKCSTLLVRREKERDQGWINRKYCGKSCASAGGIRPRITTTHCTDDQKLHVIRYTPGTSEFKAIAAQYGG